MRFLKWLRSLFTAKSVAPMQQPEFKGVDLTSSRRGASSYVLLEADPLRYWQGPMGDVRMPPKPIDPEASFRNARRPSASLAAHMRAEALAQQEQRHAQRVSEAIRKARAEEAEQRERARRTSLGGTGLGQEQSSADWAALAAFTMSNATGAQPGACSAPSPAPFTSGGGGDFGGAGAGGSWEAPAPSPSCDSSSSSSSDSGSSSSCSSSD